MKALVEGFGGGKVTAKPVGDVPPEAQKAMQDSAVAAIAAKAGSRIPVVQGPDKGLPKSAPIFDLEELRRRNADVNRQRALRKVNSGV